MISKLFFLNIPYDFIRMIYIIPTFVQFSFGPDNKGV